jgi:ubiquinone/menaquinone biosynthesis C-methylase UbiE
MPWPANLASCSFPTEFRVYREARRVLKPDGHFFFNVWDQISESEFAHVVAQALAADVVIKLVEVKKENCSYGNGDAQYA